MIGQGTTVEIALIIAIFGLIFTGVNFFRTIKKDNKNEIKAEASTMSDMSIVISKLENIGSEVSDIKRDVRDLREDQKAQSERLVRTELEIERLSKDVDKLKTDIYH